MVHDNVHWADKSLTNARTEHSMGGTDTLITVAGGMYDCRHFPFSMRSLTDCSDSTGSPMSSIETFCLSTQCQSFAQGTTTQPQPCQGTAPAAGAVCLDGVWLLPAVYVINLMLPFILTVYRPTNLTISTGATVIIVGTLTLQPNTTVAVTITNTGVAPIQANGGITLGGVLVLTLSIEPSNGLLIPIISGNTTGNFSAIDLRVPSTRKCVKYAATPVQSTQGTRASRSPTYLLFQRGVC